MPRSLTSRDGEFCRSCDLLHNLGSWQVIWFNKLDILDITSIYYSLVRAVRSSTNGTAWLVLTRSWNAWSGIRWNLGFAQFRNTVHRERWIKLNLAGGRFNSFRGDQDSTFVLRIVLRTILSMTVKVTGSYNPRSLPANNNNASPYYHLHLLPIRSCQAGLYEPALFSQETECLFKRICT